MPFRTIQDGCVITESPDKMWSTGGGNGKPSQYTCQMFKLGLEKEEELGIRLPTIAGL